MQLEGQERGINMGVTRPLLLRPFYCVFSYVTPNISAASVAIVSHCTIHETRHIAVIPKTNIFAVWGWKHCRISWKCSYIKLLLQKKFDPIKTVWQPRKGEKADWRKESLTLPLLAWRCILTYLTLVYDRNHYFGLVWYRNWYRNHILKGKSSYR